ncbi:MAG TPA: ATP-binding protein [Holophagaceae bacterium]|nr:ATP-binding protein [Holophagaceae bacterium]
MSSPTTAPSGGAGPQGPLRTLLLSMAVLSLLIGLMVLLGWHAHLLELTRLRPGSVPMRYNTALGLVLAALALAALAFGKRVAAFPGALVLALGGLTLAEYFSGRDLGIDQLFLRDYDPLGMTSPGRMAPNSAFCLLIFGAAILLASAAPRRWRPLALSLAASALMAIGLIALFGYASGVTSLTAWGRFSTMAVLTAAGVLALGLGLFAFAWGDGRRAGDPVPSWLPIPSAAAVLVGTLVVWQAQMTQQDLQLQGVMQREAQAFKQEVQVDFQARFLGLMRMARRWEVAEHAPTRAEWESDASLFVAHQPGCQALEWVDPGLRVRWVVPQAGNESVLDRDFSTDPFRRQPYDKALATGLPQVGPDMDFLQGGRGFVVCFPLSSKGRKDGFLVGVFRLDSWMEVFRGKERRVDLTLSESGRVFFQTSPVFGEMREEGLEQAFPFEGRAWQLRVAPTPELYRQTRSRVSLAVLMFGGALSILVALLIRVSQEAQDRARQVEAEVRERRKVEAVQSIILENSSVGIALVRNRTFEWANHRLAELLGMPLDRILGASSRVIYPTDEVFVRMGAISYQTMAGGGVAEDELELSRGDGSKFWCRFVGKAVDPDRVQEGSVWMFEDVTERKHTEQLKRQFLSTVSHELRTPITSIRGSLALLAAGVGGELPPDIRSMVDIALSNSVRLATLVNDILDMEKVGSGKLEVRPRSLDLAELARQALAQNLDYARPLGVSLRFDHEPESIRVWADEGRLMQVMGNLLSNAAKFSSSGSEVVLSLSRLEHAGRIEVRDSGPGIPLEFEARIFQPFSQADSSDARSRGGTGLGLSISKALVEAMGGRIGYISRPGAGAAFFVELPLDTETAPASGSFPPFPD